MKSATPKVLHTIGGLAMLGHVIRAAESINPQKIIVVLPSSDTIIREKLPWLTSGKVPIQAVFQDEPLGTGHAVLAARRAIDPALPGDTLILYGDTPALTPETLQRFLDAKAQTPEKSLWLIAMEPQQPGAYGRVIATDNNRVLAIVEASDATPAQLHVRLCNSGVMLAPTQELFQLLEEVKPTPPKNEYYLTDIIHLANATCMSCYYIVGEHEELGGVNTRVELARAENTLQQRWRNRAMINGATLIDPATVYFSFDTEIREEVIIYPHVFFGLGVRICKNVTIRPYCMLQECVLEEGVVMGPCAHIRPGTALKKGARVGNFVEVKNSTIEAGSRIDHLSYIGDATVGAGASIGAGTIICNYNGVEKFQTTIGEGAFIGSHTTLIAPVTVGEGAMTAAGSVITHDVSPDALVFARCRQTELPGQAKKFRRKIASHNVEASILSTAAGKK